MPQTVNLVLDLQNASRQPSTASDFLSLWEALEGRLHGASLQGSASWQVDIPSWGTCGLLLADPEDAPHLVTEETPFVVRSVLEPSRVFYKCATCAAAWREAYGPFICASCKDEGAPERVCDEHAVILDGSFRATCPRHSPAPPAGRGVRAPSGAGGPTAAGRRRTATATAARTRAIRPSATVPPAMPSISPNAGTQAARRPGCLPASSSTRTPSGDAGRGHAASMRTAGRSSARTGVVPCCA